MIQVPLLMRSLPVPFGSHFDPAQPNCNRISGRWAVVWVFSRRGAARTMSRSFGVRLSWTLD